MAPLKQTLSILQGKTFEKVIHWETDPIVYKAITGIAQVAPAVVTCVGHGVPDGWRVAIVSVKGMTQINTKNSPPKDSDYVIAKKLSTDTLELNTVNAAGYSAWASGGYVQYNTPQDLTGYVARMSIKDKINALTANIWQGTTVYAAGQYIVLTDQSVLVCDTAGTSGATEPTAAGIDGTVVWIAVASYNGSRELLRLTNTNSRITLDNTTKTIALTISAADTAAITWKKGIYDLELESSSGVVTALMSGTVTMTKEVTV